MKLCIKFLMILVTSCSLLAANQEQSLKPITGSEETPLMHTAAAGNVVEMRALIQSGANVHAVAFREQPHGGFPVLRYAIDSHCLEAVELLLKSGANVNDFTESPLIVKKTFLCVPGYNVRNLSLLSHALRIKAPINIIEILIQYGADVNGNPKIAGDWSALMVAAFVGYTEAVQVLLAAGADKTLINEVDGKIALNYAQEKGHLEVIKLLA